MRYMSNMVPCRTGPAISRSGTTFEQRCAETAYPSKLLAFEFSEDENVMLEFSHYKLRFLYEYRGIASHREGQVTAVNGTNPFSFTSAALDAQVGNYLVFNDFPGGYNVNGVVAQITGIAGSVYTTNWVANAGTGPLTADTSAAVVYEVTTPYSRDDVKNLRMVQWLNTCYLFCFKSDGSGDYPPKILRRYGTFQWSLLPFPTNDGPYMDVNVTTTYFTPLNTGTWIPKMTGPTTPSGVAVASSQTTNHEAWRAFDGDIDTYWEGNASQEGWIEYTFEPGFVNSMPVFASGTSGGMTISTSSNASGFAAWQVGDRDKQTDWQSSAGVPQIWQIDLGAAQNIKEYTIRASALHEEYAPANWTLEGSATGGAGTWAVLDTRTGITWASGQLRQFTVQTPASYRYYRLNITAVNQQYITTIIPATGTPGQPGYHPRKTVTTKTPSYAGFAEFQFSYNTGVPRVVDGYTIHLGRYGKGTDILDHAPKTWYFEGWDGDSYKMLDSQQNYQDWNEYRSRYFPLQNAEKYLKYRMRIKSVYKAGDTTPRIGMLCMSSPDAPDISLKASSKTGINDNRGFLATDVGRIIRVRDADNFWRWAIISAVTSAVNISINVVSADPLVLEKQVSFWRLGLWSDTTGWPICGTIHEDRLFVGGMSGFPDTICGSYIGLYTYFYQVSSQDVVADNYAIVTRCNAKVMSRITWMKSAEEAIRIGTGKQEYIMSTPVDEALSARNVKIRQTTKRGSAMHEPAYVDNDVVFIQKSQRHLYALAFSPGTSSVAASYKSALVSKLGEHLMSPPVVQIAYQQEPHSLIWGRRSDGSVVAMTYSNDDDVFGGHRHSFGGYVADIACLPSSTDRQDSMWMVIRRYVNSQYVYYIERLYHFWDYPDQLGVNGTFLDSSLRYLGTTPVSTVYGLRHMEGQYLDVLADGIVYKQVGPVTNGALTLSGSASNIVAGLPFTAEAEIVTPEAGAQDGTAQGKSKRPHSVVLKLWQSIGGEVGRWNEDTGTLLWTPIEYNMPDTAEIQDITPNDCFSKTIVLPEGYGTLGTVRFRQRDPLPFNVAGVYPQTYVEDER